MAETVGLISKQAAMDWKSQVDELNERTKQALENVDQVLTRIGGIMQGSLADELISLGNKVSTATAQLVSAMKKILEVVEGLLSAISNLIDQGKEFMGNIAKSLL